jgi:large subunit ribosomal protein L3
MWRSNSKDPKDRWRIMCKGIIGKKLGMTNIFASDGRVVPVTVVQAGPCVVTQVKRKATDGYDALQLGFGERKAKRLSQPLKGHLAKSGGPTPRTLREVAVGNPADFSPGQVIGTDLFKVGEHVDVSGTTKGRGFAGVIKRHNFHRGPETHGSKNVREPGSIGSSAWPSRVTKGKRMPGHYGHARQTVRNLEIVDIRPEENLVLIRGAIPGPGQGLVTIRKPKLSK